MQNVPVNFTVKELQVLTKLIDTAVKAEGLKVAGDGFILYQKLLVSVQMAEEAEARVKQEAEPEIDFPKNTGEIKEYLRKTGYDASEEVPEPENNVVPIKPEE